jgi:hypothetical protein
LLERRATFEKLHLRALWRGRLRRESGGCVARLRSTRLAAAVKTTIRRWVVASCRWSSRPLVGRAVTGARRRARRTRKTRATHKPTAGTTPGTEIAPTEAAFEAIRAVAEVISTERALASRPVGLRPPPSSMAVTTVLVETSRMTAAALAPAARARPQPNTQPKQRCTAT